MINIIIITEVKSKIKLYEEYTSACVAIIIVFLNG